MTAELAAAALLVVVPILFNIAFTALARSFEYPGILRRPSDEILRRFDAGGSRLRSQWWLLMVSALAMVPLATLVGVLIGPRAPELAVIGIALGVLAGLVQTLGLARWPFLVSELARRYVAAEGPEVAQTRAAIEVVFVAAHRYLGVGVGEHLGYLLTGSWTIVVAAGLLIAGGSLVPPFLAVIGIPVGIALLVGAFEFVGPNEPTGWWVADRIVPVAYIAWSIWLIALGVSFAL